MVKKISCSILFFILLSSCVAYSKEPMRTGHVITKGGKKLHCNKKNIKSGKAAKTVVHYQAKGVASWYGRQFNKRRTTSGERYDMYQMTAAHKTLPLSSYVKVTNLLNGKTVIVKVNDRGPFISHRLIDLSYAAAKKIGMVGRGLAPVSILSVKV